MRWLVAGLVLALALGVAAWSIWLAQISIGRATQSADLALQIQATAGAQALQAATAEAVAVEKAAEAVRAQAQAAELLRILRASQLASSAQLALEDDPPLALLLAVEAVNIQRAQGQPPLVQAVQSLGELLGSTGGRPLPGEPANRTAVALSPDGRWLAAGDEGGTIWLWRADLPGTPPTLLAGHTGPVWALVFLPGAERLVSAGEDGTVRLWPLGQPAAPATTLVSQSSPIYALASQPMGELLAAGSADGTIWLWSRSEPQLAARALAGHTAAVNSLAFSPDGARLASAGSDGTVRLWQWEEGAAPVAEVLTGHTDTVNVVAFSPDGEWLASGGSEGQALLWKTQAPGNPTPLRGHSLGVYAVAFAGDSQWLATADDSGLIWLWRVADPDQNALLRGHRANIRGLAFLATAAGERLLSIGYDSTIRLWDYHTPAAGPQILRGHSDSINLLAAMPQGVGFATASYDGAVRIWDGNAPFAQPGILAYTQLPIGELVLAQDGTVLAWSALDQPAVQVHAAADGRLLYALPALTSTVTALAISPDATLLATGDEAGSLRLWRLADGALLAELAGHDGAGHDGAAMMAPAMMVPSTAWLSARMGLTWPALAMTRWCGSGQLLGASSSASWPGTRTP